MGKNKKNKKEKKPKTLKLNKNKKVNCSECICSPPGTSHCLMKLEPKKGKCSEFSTQGNYQLKHEDIPHLRKAIFKIQKGICPICGQKMTHPCLDHHHKKKIGGTGLVRGVVCMSCNIFIAKSENNSIRYKIQSDELPSILRNMANYFENTQYPFIHPTEKSKPPLLQKSSYTKLVKILKKKNYQKKIPDFPKSGRITVALKELYKIADLKPAFYQK